MSTVQNVVDRFRRRYPTCAADQAVEIFNDVHRELCSRCQLRNLVETVLLTEGQGEYDLAAEVLTIHEAYYERTSDASTWTSLVERSLDEYVVLRRGWRATTSEAEPAEYYVTSAASGNSSKAQIGLWPVPALSSSDGFPRVRVYATSVLDLEADDPVPPQVLNDNVYLYGMWAKWEAERQDGNLSDLQAYQMLAERELDRNVNHMKNVQENSTTELVPAFMSDFRRVV